MISPSQVFVCGGGKGRVFDGGKDCWIVDAHREVEVKPMSEERLLHTCEYDEVTKIVYVFGGLGLKNAEAFRLNR